VHLRGLEGGKNGEEKGEDYASYVTHFSRGGIYCVEILGRDCGMTNFISEGWNRLFGHEPDSKTTACANARESMIGEYLNARKGILSPERTNFFEQLKKEDQTPYCDGRKSTLVTDSAPVGITAEQLSHLLSLPYYKSEK
jgi:hypothetical protein